MSRSLLVQGEESIYFSCLCGDMERFRATVLVHKLRGLQGCWAFNATVNSLTDLTLELVFFPVGGTL